MRYFIFVFILTTIGYGQIDAIQGSDELEDPDETQFLDQLLTRLFQPFPIRTADSTSLIEHGYSREAIESIKRWQKGSMTLESLGRKIHGDDLILLKQDMRTESQQPQIHIRQRLQYSHSLRGWRVLNKARLWNKWGSVNVLAEQDPGEDQLTDHSVLSLSSSSVPGFDHLIIGDFHVNWGGGLILNHQGARRSLNPKSLLRMKQSSIRPHYSSRETNYFSGVAGSFAYDRIKGTAFISSRTLKGLSTNSQFKEDADGVHPAGKTFDSIKSNDYGLALETNIGGTRFFAATIYQPMKNSGSSYELGFSRDLFNYQKIQIYSNSLNLNNHRTIITWAYFTQLFKVSIQYRLFNSDEVLAPGNISALLGSSAYNEKGVSARAHLRPTRKLHIRYSLDTGYAAELRSVADYRTIQRHKFQIIQKLDKSLVQLDINMKNERPGFNADIWGRQFSNLKLSKYAISLVHNFSRNFRYRVNLKSAFYNGESALLVQQRLQGEKDSWKWSIGYVRFSIPHYTLRLSVYETSVSESFSFYTAFDDGDRWFLYLRYQTLNWFELEMKLIQTQSYIDVVSPKQLAMSLQMSIVL